MITTDLPRNRYGTPTASTTAAGRRNCPQHRRLRIGSELNELVDDEHLSEAELEAFVAEAVPVASGWCLPRRHRRTSR